MVSDSGAENNMQIGESIAEKWCLDGRYGGWNDETKVFTLVKIVFSRYIYIVYLFMHM